MFISAEGEEQLSDADKVQVAEEKKQERGIEPNKSWFNMVCYGAPNLLVAQLTKP